MIDFDATITQGSFILDAKFTGDGGITALFGPSGSGKTTIINLIAGLLRPHTGRIATGDRVLVDTNSGVFAPKHKRRIGLVFQDAQLFPHLTVEQNLRFGRWFAPHDGKSISNEHVVEALGIARLLDRRPPSLSGGEKQRAGLARALLSSPDLLLMDEPLAGLDDDRKHEILPLIERMRDEFRIPIVYVTHAIDEVARLASRVVVLEAGRIRATGAPQDVFSLPGVQSDPNRFAMMSVLEGIAGPANARYDLTPVAHPAGCIFVPGQIASDGRPVRVVVRATDVILATHLPEHLSILTTLQGDVARIAAGNGPHVRVEIRLKGGAILLALATRMAIDSLGLTEGAKVYALLKSVALDERTMRG